MRYRRIWLIATTSLSILSTSAFALDKNLPAQGLIDEGWFVVKMQDQQCGHMHSLMRRVGDEVRTESDMAMELARDKVQLKLSISQEYRETLEGEAVSFRQVLLFGEKPVTTDGAIKDGRLTLTEEQYGTKFTHEYKWDSAARLAWGQLLEQRRRGLKPGTTYTVKTYDPSLRPDAPVETEIKIFDKAEVEVLGHPRKLTRVTMTMKLGAAAATDASAAGKTGPAMGALAAALPMELTTESWVDDEADPIVTEIEVGPIKMMLYKSTRDEALKTGAPVEMFINSFVKATGTVPRNAQRVKLRLRLPADAKLKMPTLPDTDMQTFVRVNDHEATLTIRRLDWKKIRAARTDPHFPPELADYLRASSMLDINNARIKRLARRAVRGAETPAEKADSLRKFVTDYITDKSLAVGFATATEVAQNRRGDCTEHGVLLAALARAAGLPARGVSGLIDIPAGYGVDGLSFGYHMWTQVHIAGQWVDLDAAMRQTDCAATHIAIGLMPLNEEGMVDSVRSLLPLMGRLQIEVLEAE